MEPIDYQMESGQTSSLFESFPSSRPLGQCPYFQQPQSGTVPARHSYYNPFYHPYPSYGHQMPHYTLLPPPTPSTHIHTPTNFPFLPGHFSHVPRDLRELISSPDTTTAIMAANAGIASSSWQPHQFEAEPPALGQDPEAVRSNSTGTTAATGFDLPPIRSTQPTTPPADGRLTRSSISSTSSMSSSYRGVRNTSAEVTNTDSASRAPRTGQDHPSVTADRRRQRSATANNEDFAASSDWHSYTQARMLEALNVVRRNENVSPTERENRAHRRRLEALQAETMAMNYYSHVDLYRKSGGGAAKSAIDTLVKVPILDIDEDDRTCSICYNVYGVANPEGIIETPLRMPKCKHIYGDVCLKRWLEEKNTCPYCRNALTSKRSDPGRVEVTRYVNSVQQSYMHSVMQRSSRQPADETAGNRHNHNQQMSRPLESLSHLHTGRPAPSRRAGARTSGGRAARQNDHGRNSANSMRSTDPTRPNMPMRTPNPVPATSYSQRAFGERHSDFDRSRNEAPPSHPGPSDFFPYIPQTQYGVVPRQSDYPVHTVSSHPVWPPGLNTGAHFAATHNYAEQPNNPLFGPAVDRSMVPGPSYYAAPSPFAHEGNMPGTGFQGGSRSAQTTSYTSAPRDNQADHLNWLEEARGERNVVESITANMLPPRPLSLRNPPSQLAQTHGWTNSQEDSARQNSQHRGRHQSSESVDSSLSVNDENRYPGPMQTRQTRSDDFLSDQRSL